MEVKRACFNCYYVSDKSVTVVREHERRSSYRRNGADLTRTDDACEVCGGSPSLKRK